MSVPAENDSLLRDIRILDLADEKASFCSKLLADMGARVIKVERPGGDASRSIGPFLRNSPHPERSLFFYHNNTNKLGITLNLENSDGREIFCRLVKGADVVIETFPPGYLKHLGLDFEVLREINARLILLSVTGFGQNGPRMNHKSCDLVAAAMSGQMYVSGSPSTPPLKPPGEQSYYAASLFAAVGILLALRKRNRSGKGEHIDISLQEAATSTLEHVMIRYFYDHIISERQGRVSWNNVFYIAPCKDGFILVTLLHQWETLVEWMDSEGMADDLTEETWNDEQYRLQRRDHVIEVLSRWTKTHTTGELFEMGQLMGFPWAPVHSPQEVVESPQLRARGSFKAIDHPEMGVSLTYPGPPYKFNAPVMRQLGRAPLIGEHNVQVLERELGLTRQEVRRLASIGAI